MGTPDAPSSDPLLALLDHLRTRNGFIESAPNDLTHATLTDRSNFLLTMLGFLIGRRAMPHLVFDAILYIQRSWPSLDAFNSFLRNKLATTQGMHFTIPSGWTITYVEDDACYPIFLAMLFCDPLLARNALSAPDIKPIVSLAALYAAQCADVLALADEIKDALFLSNVAAQLAPDNPDITQSRANVLFVSGDLAAGYACLRKAVSYAPKSSPIHLTLLDYLVEQHRYLEAETHAQTYWDPSGETVAFFLGRIHFGRGQYEDAVKQFRIAIAGPSRAYRMRSALHLVQTLSINSSIAFKLECASVMCFALGEAADNLEQPGNPRMAYHAWADFKMLVRDRLLIRWDPFIREFCNSPGVASRSAMDRYCDLCLSFIATQPLSHSAKSAATCALVELRLYHLRQLQYRERTAYSSQVRADCLRSIDSCKAKAQRVDYHMLCALETKLCTSNDDEWASAIAELEPAWLTDIAGAECERTRRILEILLWLHAFQFSKTRGTVRDNHLERAHWLIELLKGRNLLRHAPKSEGEIRSAYAAALPISIATPVVDLSQIIESLRHQMQNGIAASIYLAEDRDQLVPPALIAILATEGGATLRMISCEAQAFAQLRVDIERIRILHSLGTKSQAQREYLRTVSPSSINARECIDALLKRIGDAILEPTLDGVDIVNHDLWLSPPVELYGLPIGLIGAGNSRLSDRVRSLVVVPVFSIPTLSAQTPQEGLAVVYGPGWRRCDRESLVRSGHETVKIFDESQSSHGDAENTAFHDLHLAMRHSVLVHIVAHLDISKWADANPGALIGFGRSLLRMPGALNAGCVVLEACEAGSLVEDESQALMGIWVALLIAGAQTIVASPLAVYPATNEMRMLFEGFYADGIPRGINEISKRLRAAASLVQRACDGSNDPIVALPTFWGAYQAIGTLPPPKWN